MGNASSDCRTGDLTGRNSTGWAHHGKRGRNAEISYMCAEHLRQRSSIQHLTIAGILCFVLVVEDAQSKECSF